ncbi:MAG TPA: glycosyltransferase family 4 protein [Thermoplasmata archaeon]|nr:glycosyltransferase family 4 protein [Thermoplasmata archaeon]HLB67818.1 glycosyltransferase family 4 protein [Thermoplasmata archaeon]
MSRLGGRAYSNLPDLVVFLTSVSEGIIGGILHYLDPLERLLPGRGIDVRSFRFPKGLNLMEARGLPKPVRIPIHVAYAILCLIRILRLRHQYGTILVHSHGASYVLLTAFLAKFLGHPAVHTFHSPWTKHSLTLRLLSPRIDGLVFVSKSLEEMFKSFSSVRNEFVRYVPGAVNVDLYHPISPVEKQRARQQFLQEYGLPNRGKLVIFVGRVTPVKGVAELVEAVAHLKAFKSPVSVLIVGPVLDSEAAHAYLERLERIVSKFQLQDYVVLTGALSYPKKADLIAAADLLVSPSLWEASSITVVEAFATGIPVVASRAGGLTERVQPGENGLLVDPGDPRQLADAIDRLVRDDSVRLEMGRKARETAVRVYSEEELVNKHLKLYAAVLSRVRASRSEVEMSSATSP